ncbi:hypothetical protein SDJN02_05929 [Cucurbita argyrosperma subsp. argyrosperma]|nr:hypothetical protein SDJN02_05929 [Cucurbita argyrosperma subsp. argyrosperma]
MLEKQDDRSILHVLYGTHFPGPSPKSYYSNILNQGFLEHIECSGSNFLGKLGRRSSPRRLNSARFSEIEPGGSASQHWSKCIEGFKIKVHSISNHHRDELTY